MDREQCIYNGTHLVEVDEDGFCRSCGHDEGPASLRIGGVEYSKTAGDGPPDQVQVKLYDYVTITVYVQEGRYVVVEIDGDADGERVDVPFRVYRNDGVMCEDGADAP